MLIKAGHKVTVNSKESLINRDELTAAVAQYDAIITLLTEKVDEKILSSAGKQLKIIANYAVGYDNIDVRAATGRGIIVTNTPDVLTNAVAEHTVALLAALARRIVEADAYLRAGHYQGWRPMLLLGTELTGKTLGVIGSGRIGSEVAQRAKHGFGMKIAYSDLRPNADFEQKLEATFYKNVDDLLPISDVVTLHVPLLPATRHLINTARLAIMKRSALIINTSRGPIVDEEALVLALQNKTINGAALDVFEDEPKLKPGLKELPNVVLTPHIASATTDTRAAMAKMAAQNVLAVLAGKPALNPVGT